MATDVGLFSRKLKTCIPLLSFTPHPSEVSGKTLTFRMTLASTLGSSCTKMQEPFCQVQKRVQAAFTQPVSDVFQKMSDSVKAMNCLPTIREKSEPSAGASSNPLKRIPFSVLPSLQPCPHWGVTSADQRARNLPCLSKHLSSTFYIPVLQASDTEFQRQIPCLQVVCSQSTGVIDKGTNDPNTM